MPDEIAPPFVVAVGEILPFNPGAEIAVASRFQPGPVLIYAVTGKTLHTLAAPVKELGTEGIHLVVLKTNNAESHD